MTAYEEIHHIIMEFQNSADRAAAAVLAQTALDLKLPQSSPMFQHARAWFYLPTYGKVSLNAVCSTLRLNVKRVQNLATDMIIEQEMKEAA